MANKLTLCIDFDGVLHSYKSGWQGADVIPDPPVPGALEFVAEAVKHFTVAIYSSRSHQLNGIEAMKKWLFDHAFGDPEAAVYDRGKDLSWLTQIEWPTHKPAAFITLDDRALTFDGTWPSMEALKEFKPWNKKNNSQ